MRALITGVNSLTNKAMLDKLVAMGYDVTAQYHRDNDITKELKKQYSKVRFVQADFSSKDGFMKFVAATMDGKYDVLVNGAVYYCEADGAWKTSQQDWDEWQKSFAVNVTTCGVMMAHGDLTMNHGGVIINISSTIGQTFMADTGFTIYSACKAALDSLTVAYAKRWAPDIRVVGIGPGWIHSKWNDNMPNDDKAAMLARHGLRDWVEPEEIADLMETIIKVQSINATTFIIDNGLGAPIVG